MGEVLLHQIVGKGGGPECHGKMYTTESKVFEKMRGQKDVRSIEIGANKFEN